MTDWKLPTEVRRLIQGPVGTMAHLELLLALRRAAPVPCSPAELAEATRLPPGPVVRRCVDDLVRAGLVLAIADVDAYRYAPKTDALREVVDVLASMHRRRPVLLARAFYSRPVWR